MSARVPIALRLPAELAELASALAEEQGRTRHDVLVAAIRQGLRRPLMTPEQLHRARKHLDAAREALG